VAKVPQTALTLGGVTPPYLHYVLGTNRSSLSVFHRFLPDRIGRCCSKSAKNGSSRITGKDALDLHEKQLAIPVTVRHSLDDLYSIVYSFQLTGVHRPAHPAHDTPPVTLYPPILVVVTQALDEVGPNRGV